MKASIGNLANKMLGHGPGVLWAMIVGGVLWVVLGYFRFLTPLGLDVTFREDLGYSQILRTALFLLYNLPGVLALLLTAWAALSYLTTLRAARTGLKRAAQVFALLASLLGLVAAAGQIIQFDPLTTGGLRLGAPILGLALFLAGLSVGRDSNRQEGHQRLLVLELIMLGVIGMATLPVGTIIYALALLPHVFGTGLYALFGAGWIILGFSLRNETVKDAGAAYA